MGSACGSPLSTSTETHSPLRVRRAAGRCNQRRVLVARALTGACCRRVRRRWGCCAPRAESCLCHSHLSSLSRFASSVIISPGPGTPHVAGDIGACGQHVGGAASSPQPDNSLLDTQACAGPCWRSVRTCPSWECASATRRWRQSTAARWSGPQSLCTGACLLSCTTATPCLRTSRQGRPTRCACVACLRLDWMTDRLVEMDGAHRL